MKEAIHFDTALNICKEIRKHNQGKWYSFYGMWCWGCNIFSKQDSNNLCFNKNIDNRGCSQVNNRYDRS